MTIRRVAVVGGTHGNELTGVALVRQIEAARSAWSGLELRTLIGNPEAVRQCRRYIDQDLNRSFRRSDLASPELDHHEHHRAREIAEELCPGGEVEVDLIVDLHTTTSNMGVALLLAAQSPFEVALCASVIAEVQYRRPSGAAASGGEHPRLVLLGGLWKGDPPYLKSLAPNALAIEVGPIPQGVLRHDIFAQTRDTLNAVLHYTNRVSQGDVPPSPTAVDAYEAITNVPYPQTAEGPMLVHDALQDRDWQPLQTDQPLFIAPDGTIERCPAKWDGLCPIFVNEAAYYPETAFVLTRRVRLAVPRA